MLEHHQNTRRTRPPLSAKPAAIQGKRPRGIERKQLLGPIHKGVRLKNLRHLGRHFEPEEDKGPERIYPSPSSADSISSQHSSAFIKSSVSDRKRKRTEESEDPLSVLYEGPTEKRLRTSLISPAVDQTSGQKAESEIKNTDPIKHWVQEGSWPKEYFTQDSQTRKDLEQGTSKELERMAHLLARQKSSASLRRQNPGPGTVTPSDQQPREGKSANYRTASYEMILATKGSFMGTPKVSITDSSKTLCQNLLRTDQPVPEGSIFADDSFKKAIDKVHHANEARVVQDITRLIVPSGETLDTLGTLDLGHLVESVDQGWNSSIPFYASRPQPDYSIGFGRSAFTDDQLTKLKPFVGEIADDCTSYFMATWYMYFPFLTCEVKCGAEALNIADRQNAHSMTLAVRGVVELFKFVKREKELDREILAFSISHDDRTVRIYGHYAMIKDDQTHFYRHLIRDFSFIEQEGKEKWTAYKFTKNVYDKWMPGHLEKIRSAINDLPDRLDFDVSLGGSLVFAATAAETESGPPPSNTAMNPPPPLQKAGSSKRQKLTPNQLLQQNTEQQRQEIERQRQENEKLMGQQKEENERQRQESEKLKAQHKEENERQRQESDQLKVQLRDLMELLKQQSLSTASSANEVMLQQDAERQRQEVERQRQENEKLKAQQKEENERQRQEVERQRQENEKLKAQQKEEKEKLMAHQKEENERQRQESEQLMAQQKEENKQLKEQIKELMGQISGFMKLFQQQNSAKA